MLDDERVRELRARTQALAGGVREASAAAVVRQVFAIQAQDATAADRNAMEQRGDRAKGRDANAGSPPPHHSFRQFTDRELCCP